MDKISALMDGELDDHEARAQFTRLRHDDELTDCWHTFHVIGDTLRGEQGLSPGFNRRLADRLAGEPTALAPLVALGNALLRPRTRARFGSLEAITRFRPEWDPIWNGLLKQHYELYGHRDAEFLNYKLAQPNRTYFTHLHRDPAGVIDGYIVYRRARHRVRDLDVVKICDFVGSRTARLDMLAAAMRFAIADAPGTYGIVGLSSVAEAAEFRSMGMYVARPYPVVLAAGVDGRVRVSFFDSDLDNLW